MQQHIKEMTELFESLAVIGDAISEEDRVVHLLASLPESYDMLVTALEANSENVPAMENVTEGYCEKSKSSRKRMVEKKDEGPYLPMETPRKGRVPATTARNPDISRENAEHLPRLSQRKVLDTQQTGLPSRGRG